MGILRTDVVSHSQLSNGNASVLFDGTTDSITIPSHSAFAFGTADWTVEGWFYFTSLSGQQTLVGDTYGGTAGWYLYKQNNHRLGVYYSSLLVDGNTLIETDRWYHLAFVRHSGRTRIYINGELDAEGADTTNATVTQYYIADTADQTSGEFFGNISNLRITRTAVYKDNFTVPKFKLKEIPGTILLCCQSSSSTTEATVSVPGTLTANGDPTATAFGPGLKDDITDTGVVFDGVTTFDSLAYMVPPSGKTTERNRGRALLGGGHNGSSATNHIHQLSIQSQGNTEDFGDLTVARWIPAAVSSSTRGVWNGGGGPYVNTSDFVTIANSATATDLGDLTEKKSYFDALSNETRGVIGGGYNDPGGSRINVIEFITIATAGNAQDFGDLTVVRMQVKAAASPTRGLFMGGDLAPNSACTNVVDYITIASAGNAQDFGDMTAPTKYGGATSSNVRAIYAGGNAPNDSTFTDKIEFFTIATLGNGTDFGDLITARSTSPGTTSNNIRGVISGGYTPSGNLNSIEFVTIASTGNAQDFGDISLGLNMRGIGACSDSHGGLS